MRLTSPELVETFRALRIKQKWWSSDWHFVIKNAAGRIVGEIRGSSWTWRHRFVTVEGVVHTINVTWDPPWWGARCTKALECDAIVVAKARASGGMFLTRTYVIEHAGKQYKLKLLINRGWIVYDHTSEIGTLIGESWDTAILNFHKEAPVLLRLFAFYLTVSYSLED